MDGLGETGPACAGWESGRSLAQNPPHGYRADSPPDGREGEAQRVPYVAAISGKGGAYRQRASRRAQSAAAFAGGERPAAPSAEKAPSGGGEAGRNGGVASVPAGRPAGFPGGLALHGLRGPGRGRCGRRASRGSGAPARKQHGRGDAHLWRGPCFEAGRTRKTASHRDARQDRTRRAARGRCSRGRTGQGHANEPLFGGGTGEMRLTDQENIAESGIDIVCSPPGKRLQNVLLLSGGEKALAAVALLRSEEHTSELQSLRHLVCRLLLE